MEPLIPDQMDDPFEGSKSSRILAVHGMEEADSNWLAMRLLGDWLRQCDTTEGVKSEVGIVVLSMKHDFEYYARYLEHFGIDLRLHEELGHFHFVGSLFVQLLGDLEADPPIRPRTDIEALKDLICDESDELKDNYSRTVMFWEGPELLMPLIDDEDGQRLQDWQTLIQGAAFQFHNAFFSLMRQLPDMSKRDPLSFYASMDAIGAVDLLELLSDMSMNIRGGLRSDEWDANVVVTYRMDYQPPHPGFIPKEELFAYRIGPNGRNVQVIDRVQIE